MMKTRKITQLKQDTGYFDDDNSRGGKVNKSKRSRKPSIYDEMDDQDDFQFSNDSYNDEDENF